MSRSRIKHIKAIMWFGAVLFALAIAARASAQFGMPQVPSFRATIPGSTMSRSIRETKAFVGFWQIIRTSRGHSHGIRGCSTMPIGTGSIPSWSLSITHKYRRS